MKEASSIASCKALTAWANTRLEERNISIDDPGFQFRDGINIGHLLEVLTNRKLIDKYFKKTPEYRIDKVNNVKTCFKIMKVFGVKLTMTPEEIVDGCMEPTMDLLWALILYFEVHKQHQSKTQTAKNLESAKTEMTAWVSNRSYPEYVTKGADNFNKWLSDGKAICALVNKICPFERVPATSKGAVNLNVGEALNTCESALNVPICFNSSEVTKGTFNQKNMIVFFVMLRLRDEQVDNAKNGSNNTPFAPQSANEANNEILRQIEERERKMKVQKQKPTLPPRSFANPSSDSLDVKFAQVETDSNMGNTAAGRPSTAKISPSENIIDQTNPVEENAVNLHSYPSLKEMRDKNGSWPEFQKAAPKGLSRRKSKKLEKRQRQAVEEFDFHDEDADVPASYGHMEEIVGMGTEGPNNLPSSSKVKGKEPMRAPPSPHATDDESNVSNALSPKTPREVVKAAQVYPEDAWVKHPKNYAGDITPEYSPEYSPDESCASSFEGVEKKPTQHGPGMDSSIENLYNEAAMSTFQTPDDFDDIMDDFENEEDNGPPELKGLYELARQSRSKKQVVVNRKIGPFIANPDSVFQRTLKEQVADGLTDSTFSIELNMSSNAKAKQLKAQTTSMKKRITELEIEKTQIVQEHKQDIKLLKDSCTKLYDQLYYLKTQMANNPASEQSEAAKIVQDAYDNIQVLAEGYDGIKTDEYGVSADIFDLKHISADLQKRMEEISYRFNEGRARSANFDPDSSPNLTSQLDELRVKLKNMPLKETIETPDEAENIRLKAILRSRVSVSEYVQKTNTIYSEQLLVGKSEMDHLQKQLNGLEKEENTTGGNSTLYRRIYETKEAMKVLKRKMTGMLKEENTYLRTTIATGSEDEKVFHPGQDVSDSGVDSPLNKSSRSISETLRQENAFLIETIREGEADTPFHKSVSVTEQAIVLSDANENLGVMSQETEMQIKSLMERLAIIKPTEALMRAIRLNNNIHYSLEGHRSRLSSVPTESSLAETISRRHDAFVRRKHQLNRIRSQADGLLDVIENVNAKLSDMHASEEIVLKKENEFLKKLLLVKQNKDVTDDRVRGHFITQQLKMLSEEKSKFIAEEASDREQLKAALNGIRRDIDTLKSEHGKVVRDEIDSVEAENDNLQKICRENAIAIGNIFQSNPNKASIDVYKSFFGIPLGSKTTNIFEPSSKLHASKTVKKEFTSSSSSEPIDVYSVDLENVNLARKSNTRVWEANERLEKYVKALAQKLKEIDQDQKLGSDMMNRMEADLHSERLKRLSAEHAVGDSFSAIKNLHSNLMHEKNNVNGLKGALYQKEKEIDQIASSSEQYTTLLGSVVKKMKENEEEFGHKASSYVTTIQSLSSQIQAIGDANTSVLESLNETETEKYSSDQQVKIYRKKLKEMEKLLKETMSKSKEKLQKVRNTMASIVDDYRSKLETKEFIIQEKDLALECMEEREADLQDEVLGLEEELSLTQTALQETAKQLDPEVDVFVQEGDIAVEQPSNASNDYMKIMKENKVLIEEKRMLEKEVENLVIEDFTKNKKKRQKVGSVQRKNQQKPNE
eukprot:Nk52_evm125s221 gene=Nk52_evmTU125s221